MTSISYISHYSGYACAPMDFFNSPYINNVQGVPKLQLYRNNHKNKCYVDSEELRSADYEINITYQCASKLMTHLNTPLVFDESVR